jgi:hypothetical protein
MRTQIRSRSFPPPSPPAAFPAKAGTQGSPLLRPRPAPSCAQEMRALIFHPHILMFIRSFRRPAKPVTRNPFLIFIRLPSRISRPSHLRCPPAAFPAKAVTQGSPFLCSPHPLRIAPVLALPYAGEAGNPCPIRRLNALPTLPPPPESAHFRRTAAPEAQRRECRRTLPPRNGSAATPCLLRRREF